MPTAKGRRSCLLAYAVLTRVVRQFDPGPGGHFLLGVDDAPTQRYGRQIAEAGVHHHPTPGPAGGEWLSGHNGASLVCLVRHPAVGA